MPEGPEIRLAADALEQALVGQRLNKVLFAQAPLRRFEKHCQGAEVRAVDTRGKALLTRLSNGWTIYSHNQLYGRWEILGPESLPDTQRQIRLALYTEKSTAVLLSASDIAILKDEELLSHPFLAKLGPDLLSENPSPQQIAERLSDARFAGRNLGALLLDQAFVAGLGNYLRAEILFDAQCSPWQKPRELTLQKKRRLARAILRITERAYRKRGLVNPPKWVKALKAKGISEYEQIRFAVYGREDCPCYHCGTRIRRQDIGGRHVFYCPNCQQDETL